MPMLSRARDLASALERRPRLLRTLEAIVAVVVIGLCAYGVKGDWSKAGPQLADARLGDVALALGTVVVYYLVFIFGWIRILAAWNIRVPYRVALQAEMASMLAKYVPGGVWTPAARVAALSRLTGETQTGTVLASILVEAILSAISGVLVFVVSLAWVHNVDAPLAPLAAFALVCVLILHPRVFGPAVTRLLRPFGLVSIEPLPFPTMATLLAYYCFTWLIGGLGLYFLIRSVGAAPGLATIPFLGGTSAIGAIVTVLAVFAPSGLGVREASMYALLIAVTSNSAALGATILNRLTITIVELALFLVGIAIWRLGRPSAPPKWDPDGFQA
jgi:glycosyltransferase 2 family protein